VALSVNPRCVVLLAAEPSADALGAAVAQHWLAQDPNIHLVGMAGPLMRAAGVKALWQMEDVSVMGLWEVLKQYRRLKRLQTSLIHQLSDLKPDLVLGIDGPDFNLPIEAAMKRLNIPCYHFVAPTVWAWRPKRAERIAMQTDGLLCLFPFEPPYFLVHDLPAAAVGHPLADRLPLVPNKTAARAALGLSESDRVLAVLPGSRKGEWQYNAPIFWQTLGLLLVNDPDLVVIVPCLHERMQQTLQASAGDLPIRWVLASEGASRVLTAADVALVASGTATLETALCHTPMVVAYRLHWLSFLMMNALRQTQWVALPNVIANRALVPELLQDDATPEALVAAVLPLLSRGSSERQAQVSAFGEMHQQLRLNAAQSAVNQVLAWWRERVDVRAALSIF
jgi:lipid-A-disaccharide synthase